MTKKLKTGLVAAAIAAIVGLAVSYGLITQKTGDEIRTQTDEILNEDNAAEQPPATDNTPAEQPAPTTETQPPAQDTEAPSPAPDTQPAPQDSDTTPPATDAPETPQPSE